MEINEGTIDAFHTLLTKPGDHGLDFTPLPDFFDKAETVTPKHILAKAYIDYMAASGRTLNKLVLYIVMDKVFGQCHAKASNGDLGYHLTPKNKDEQTTDRTG